MNCSCLPSHYTLPLGTSPSLPTGWNRWSRDPQEASTLWPSTPPDSFATATDSISVLRDIDWFTQPNGTRHPRESRESGNDGTRRGWRTKRPSGCSSRCFGGWLARSDLPRGFDPLTAYGQFASTTIKISKGSCSGWNSSTLTRHGIAQGGNLVRRLPLMTHMRM